MTSRPTRFYIEYDLTGNPDVDPLDLRMENVDTKEEARRLAESVSRNERVSVLIVERTNIVDATPPEDPPGLLWDWDEDRENTEEVWIEQDEATP